MAKAKHSHYKFKPSGEVFPALRHPDGYEDGHPEDWEPVDPAQEAAAAEANAAPADLTPAHPPIPDIPPLAPQVPPNTEPTVVTDVGNLPPLEDTEIE